MYVGHQSRKYADMKTMYNGYIKLETKLHPTNSANGRATVSVVLYFQDKIHSYVHLDYIPS